MLPFLRKTPTQDGEESTNLIGADSDQASDDQNHAVFSSPYKSLRRWTILACLGVVFILNFAILGVLLRAGSPLVFPSTTNENGQTRHTISVLTVTRTVTAETTAYTQPICEGNPLPRSIKAEYRNIWHGLTNQEVADVISFLHSDLDLNLTSVNRARNWDNRIMTVELLQPNKSTVLSYLSNAANAPARFARATILFGATLEAYAQDFMIGPLPITSSTTAIPLEFLYTRHDNRVPVRNIDVFGSNLTERILDVASGVTSILWDPVLIAGLRLESLALPETHDGRVTMWYAFMNSPTSLFDSGTLLPLGLYVRCDITGRDTSKWQITGWLYNNVLYYTIGALLSAMGNPDFQKYGVNSDGPWARMEAREPQVLDTEAPPISAQPGPPRYRLDKDENYVSWMDFSFYMTSTRDTGVKLFDLGMEEALAHYAGIDPVQSTTCLLDSTFGFGTGTVSLVKGYDCPAYSTYINTSYVAGESKYIQENGICLFEYDPGYPIQRHSASGYSSVTKNHVFTVRSVSTLANYDYMTSYDFHMDGSISISVRASGYILSAFFAHNEEYGFKIHDNLSGSMHDHVVTFKADLDIGGQRNSLQKVSIVPTTESYAWDEQRTRNTMKISRSFVDSEDSAKINWAQNSATQYSVVNRDTPNAHGEFPGYRLIPGNSIHLTVENSTVARNSVNLARYHAFVTQHKDTEARASHALNALDPDEPLIDFDKFLDGDSLEQEDLVLWFNLGMHHIPHTGDLPNTVFTTSHSMLTIAPFNYLPGDPSRVSAQQVRMNIGQNGEVTTTSFGAQNLTCAIDTSRVHSNLLEYDGAMAIHKYPYDGAHLDRVGQIST